MKGRLLLMRHPRPIIEMGVCYGRLDLDVTDNYCEEVKRPLNYLLATDIRAVYSSPLIRCAKLAHLISEDITWDERLMEMDFGDWEGESWQSIFESEEGKHWFAHWHDAPTPRGESNLQLRERVAAFLEEIAENEDTQLLVTHAGVIRAVLSLLGMMSLDESLALELEYASLIAIETENNKLIWKRIED